MTAKKLSVVLSILLIVALLVGCGAQIPSDETGTTVTVPSMNDGISTTAHKTNATTLTSQALSSKKSTTDCIQTTTVVSTPLSSTNLTQSTERDTTSTVVPASTTASTSATTEAPTVHTLTPLAPSSYYGASKLKSLPNGTVLVEAYEKIVNAVQNCQTTVTIDEKLTESEALMAFYYYQADYPHHFWCDGSIRYTISERSNKVVKIQLSYTMAGDQLLQAQIDFNNAVVELLEIAATGKDEYERELLLHDALARRVTYQEGENAHNAYGALVKGKAVCEGYSRGFQYLLYQSGIQCLMAEGSSINPSTGLSESHAWNVVRVDGQYYHVDLTWDDPDDVKTPVMYPYFNLTTVQINNDHTINSDYGYALPNCMATANNFHVKNGTRLTEYTVDSVARVFKGDTGNTHVYCSGGSQGFVDWFHTNHNAVFRAIGINGSYSYNILYTGNEVVVRLTII